MKENYLLNNILMLHFIRLFLILTPVFGQLCIAKVLPPGTYDVNNASQLSAALIAANNDRINSTINLNPGNYSFSSDINDPRAGDGLALPVIEPDNGSTLTINGNFQELSIPTSRIRILYINSGATVIINNLTFKGGYPTPGAGGGAIYNEGNLTLNECNFLNNSTEDSNGGAIANEGGIVTVDKCYFFQNIADGLGTIRGAGLYQRTGTMTVTNSTFELNNAGEGAGIFIDNGVATVINCTFYDNNNVSIAAEQGNVRLINCTVAFNSGSDGLSNIAASFSLKNTIVANNLLDVAGTFIDLGHNMIGNTFGSNGFNNATSLPDVDPLLEFYTYDGGVTNVITLNPASEAIDNGSTESDVPKKDQRGYLRDDKPDIGAYEFQAGVPVDFLYASFVKQTGFRIEWISSPSADRYLIDVSTDPNFSAGSFVNGFQNLPVNNTASFVDVNGLADGIIYYFRVKIQKGSNISQNDVISSIRTLTSTVPSPTLNPPTGVNQSSFTISWSLVLGANEYRLDIATGPNFNPNEIYSEFFDYSVSSTSTFISGLIPGTIYYARVRAVIGDKVSLSSATRSIITTATPPAAPSNLQVIASSTDRITLNWQDNSNNETSFEIERSRGGASSFELIDIVDANITTYTDNFLDKSVTYFYRVRAVNSAGPSAYTQAASIATLNTPQRPGSLEAYAVSSSEIFLTWTDNSFNESFFEIERASDPAQGFVLIGTSLADESYYFDFTAVPNQINFYRVRAVSTTEGKSEYSNVAGARAADIPSEPQSLVASTLNSNQIRLTWADSSSNELGFRIEVSNIVETNGFFTEIAQVGPDETSFLDSNLIGNQTYTYRLLAYNENGTSIYSNEASATTLIDANIAPPVAPSSLLAEAVTDSEILLRWDDNSPNESSFLILRSEQPFFGFEIIAEVVGGTSRYQDVGLTEGVLYYYHVQASNEGGESELSNRAFAQPACNLTVAVSIDDDKIISRICDDKSAFLVASTNTSVGEYQWFRNDKPIPNANLNIYQATEDGEYNCRILSGINCEQTASNPVVVILDDLFSIDLSFEDGTLFASVVGAQSYQWYYDYQVIPGATGDIFRPSQEGIYYVEVTLDGCSATSDLFFYQIAGDKIKNISDQIKIYPNPSPDWVEFNLESGLIGGEYTIQIYDTKGQKFTLEEGVLTTHQFTRNLDLSQLPAGIYFVEFTSERAAGRRKIFKY